MTEIKTFGETAKSIAQARKLEKYFEGLVSAPTPPAVLKPSDTITARVRRELKHTGVSRDVREDSRGIYSTGYMTGNYSLTLCFAFNCASYMLATRHSIKEAVRMYCAPNDTSDVPPARTSELTIPNAVSNVNTLPQAYVWHSMDKELCRLVRLHLL